MMKLKVAGFAKNSVVDGPGIRYTIFTQGCYHNCEGCHNPQTHNPNDGYFVDLDAVYEEIVNDDTLSGVTFSGGEPFLQAEALSDLAFRIKNETKFDIICYTGYTYEEIMKITEDGCHSYRRLLNNIDYLIDGRYDKNKASLDCNWRGSTNQRIINVSKSIQSGEVVVEEI